MIYFDNAATGGFKIRAVKDAVNYSLSTLLANPGRSGHRLSVKSLELVYSCRETLAKYFSCEPERVIFTKNCTEALNQAIFGSKVEKGHVITTVFEHNSVLRPLFNLKQQGLIDLDVVSNQDDDGLIRQINGLIRENTYLIATTAVSNVTGRTLPIAKIGSIAKANNLLYLVDGAQGGGHVRLNMKEQNISMLALAGHKGLCGIMGSGALLIDSSVDLLPLNYGGSGIDTFNESMPSSYPEKLEAGTLNLPAISALKEGCAHALENLDSFSNYLTNITKYLIDKLSSLSQLTCYSSPNSAGIVAFKHDTIDSQEIADILSSDYDIAVRGGFHCAPLMHRALETEKSGLVRVSLAVHNTYREVDYFIKSLSSIIY